jgi:hypothetical protein
MKWSLKLPVLLAVVPAAFLVSGCVIPWSQPTSPGTGGYSVIESVIIPAGAGTVRGNRINLIGSTATLTAAPYFGYIFSEWGGAAAGSGNPCRLAVTSAPQSVTAIFSPRNVLVMGGPDTIGTGFVAGGGYYAFMSTTTLTASAEPMYHFSYWDISSSSDHAYSFTDRANPLDLLVDGRIDATAFFFPDP